MVEAEYWAPSENRIICREALESGFIALMTCEGSCESAWHAEPDEAQMPGSCSGDFTSPFLFCTCTRVWNDRKKMAM